MPSIFLQIHFRSVGCSLNQFKDRLKKLLPVVQLNTLLRIDYNIPIIKAEHEAPNKTEHSSHLAPENNILKS